MSGLDWARKVFRLRRVPYETCTPAAVQSLLCNILGLPSDHVVVHSVARTTEIFEVPSRTATLQMKSIPACLQHALANNEWALQVTGRSPADVLILDTHFVGMTILYDPPPSRHQADCIAISGLASHPFGSWQPRGQDKTFMWIRDTIPAACPEIRTVIYGYDSKLTTTRSFQSITDISLGLILHLKSGGWNRPSSKPLVFLAHSLGGLVLKEAIVQMAENRDQTVSDVLRNVCGAIMFGVPSLGMEQSHLMAMVEGQPNESLVQDLSRDANYVRQLNARFEGLSFLRTARIFWAYETEESPTVEQRPDGSWERSGSFAILVNRESATSNYYRKDKSVIIPIAKDHSAMVKFRRGDTTLAIIVSSITEILTAVQPTSVLEPPVLCSILTTQPADVKDFLVPGRAGTDGGNYSDFPLLTELDTILSSLEELHLKIFSTELNFRIQDIGDPFKDTFSWIFDLPAFREWLQEGSGLFWIYGKPGSGKSTLMKLIFQHRRTWELLHNWQRNSIEIIAGFFFHYRGSTIQRSFEGLLCSLVLQILAPVRDPYLRRYQDTWKEYKPIQEKLALQRSQLGDERRLLSGKTSESRELETNQNDIRQKLAQLHSMQSGPQNATADVSAEQIESTDPSREELESRQERLLDRQKVLVIEEARHRANIKTLEANIASIHADLTQLEKRHAGTPFKKESETKLLKDVATIFRNQLDWAGLIPTLEGILRQLLDQTNIDMDVMLFFDALDEFDGHLEMISRFMKTILRDSVASKTRVKVCMSSRPWETLKAHFASYPKFALQDYTNHDIAEYAAGTVSALPETATQRLIPTILERANGVFLWVKLAVNVLLQPATETEPPDSLEERLDRLPDDLFQFYELIIERISKQNRRYTFALLELLLRHNGPPADLYQIRDTVLISGSKTFSEAVAVLKKQESSQPSAADDIHTWSGGLVEIKSQNGILQPQLMHQTLFEFITRLNFKKLVLGDLANIIHENGHSFHVKYWVTTRPQRTIQALGPQKLDPSSAVEPSSPASQKTVSVFGMLQPFDEVPYYDTVLPSEMALPELPSLVSSWMRKRTKIGRIGDPVKFLDRPVDAVLAYPTGEELDLQIFAFHAEKSELTTGKSQYDFFLGVPYALLDIFSDTLTKSSSFSSEPWLGLVSFAASFNLTLLLRDWKERRSSTPLQQQIDTWPLLSSLVFCPPLGETRSRCLITARLLLESGFKMTLDPLFFPRVLKELWLSRLLPDSGVEGSVKRIPASDLLNLAMLVLEHKQSPDTKVHMQRSKDGGFFCRPLQLALPQLAGELIKRGADPTLGDSQGLRPIDWILGRFGLLYLPEECGLDCSDRYEMCNILLSSPRMASVYISQQNLKDAIAEFEKEGYDTTLLQSCLQGQLGNVAGSNASSVISSSIDAISSTGAIYSRPRDITLQDSDPRQEPDPRQELDTSQDSDRPPKRRKRRKN